MSDRTTKKARRASERDASLSKELAVVRRTSIDPRHIAYRNRGGVDTHRLNRRAREALGLPEPVERWRSAPEIREAV